MSWEFGPFLSPISGMGLGQSLPPGARHNFNVLLPQFADPTDEF